ncbi:MAG: ATP-binding protein, partial [Methylococcales bacterium]
IKIVKYTGEPYRGLEKFEYQHRPIYFGRAGDIKKLRDDLIDRESHGTPGLLIVSASGAGKSSLVRAGLIPALQEGPYAVPDKPVLWAVWRPGDAQGADESALARSVRAAWLKEAQAKACFAGIPEVASLLELAEESAKALTAGHFTQRRFVWLIDQFEELFTAAFNSAVLERFAAFLKGLQRTGVWLIATLRGDFYDHYLQSGFLGLFGNDGQYNLSRLDGAAFDQIIKGPAQLADLQWEADANGISLADRIVKDLGDRPDALPLLEFAL